MIFNIKSKTGINPLNIPGILSQVLGYVDSTKSLLNCRLVSQSWNHAATKLLNEKGCTIGLDSIDLESYIALMSSNPGLSTLNVNLRIRLKWYSAEEEGHIYFIERALFTNDIAICGLTITAPSIACSKSTPIELALRKVLEWVAPTLRFLLLSGEVTFSTNESNVELTFPNLCLIHCFGGSCSSELSQLLASIISYSPKLQELGLIGSIGSEGFARVISHLKSKLHHSDLLCLEKLELSIHNVEAYNGLCGLKLHKLKRLILHDNIHQALPQVDVNNNNTFGEFISSKCRNLTCLELYLRYAYHGLIDHILKCSLPLTQIKTFGYYLKLDHRYYDDIFPSTFLQLLRKFPSMNNIKWNVWTLASLAKLYTGYMRNSTSIIPEAFQSSILPSVTTVQVALNLFGYETNFENSLRTINILLTLLFPNVVNLNLEQQLVSKTRDDSNYHHLTVIPCPPYNLLVAILCSWNELGRLKINGYVDDWLNFILAIAQKTQGDGNLIQRRLLYLELLHIHGLKRRHHNFEEYNATKELVSVTPCFYGRPPSFDLVQFVKYIPTIDTVQIDDALLVSPFGIKEQIRVKARKLTNNVFIKNMPFIIFILIIIFSLGLTLFIQISIYLWLFMYLYLFLNYMRERKKKMNEH